jgi:hypothetical protein
MKHLKKLGVAAAMSMALVACVGATSASATGIHPGSTAVTLSSTNSSLSIHGSSTINCTSSTITGTTPPTADITTWVSIKATLAYSGCTAFGIIPATVTVPAVCQAAGASAVTLHIMGTTVTTADGTVTIPSGCTITVDIPAASCTLTFAGPQTVGAASGIDWTNGSSTVFSFAQLTNALVPSISSSGGSSGCPTAGAHTGTLNGRYTVTSPTPAPGVIVTP